MFRDFEFLEWNIDKEDLRILLIMYLVIFFIEFDWEISFEIDFFMVEEFLFLILLFLFVLVYIL